MSLANELLKWLQMFVPAGSRLQSDSRQIKAGDVFIGLPGQHVHGNQFFLQAVQDGAIAGILDDRCNVAIPIGFPVIFVPQLETLIAHLAHQWYGQPSAAMHVIAVTGTNGKTTTVNGMMQILTAHGLSAASIGTLGVLLPNGENLGASLTTPNSLDLHYYLFQLQQKGVQYVLLEASSIGIAQGRLGYVQIDSAGLTNLTQDHLDYHRTLERYASEKAKLFRSATVQHRVLNIDDAFGQTLWEQYPEAISYSLHQSQATLYATVVQGQQGAYELHYQGQAFAVRNACLGEHNIANQLLMTGLLLPYLDIHQIVAGLNALQPIRGRLERVSLGGSSEPLVVVDYAHTPDALEHALQTVQPLAQRVACVFSCGGDRDKQKRPIMGQIAQQYADQVIITSDNPRTEDPYQIALEVQVAPEQRIELDRAVAIMQTILQADETDVVLIAGKGHETYQDSAGAKIFFDDVQWAKLGLAMRQQRTVQTDSRHVQAGDIFVALIGERFDAHDFVPSLPVGAIAVVERLVEAPGIIQIQVDNTQSALMKMAIAWRRQFAIPVIAVTGSNGKTTCKEMIASILNVASDGHYVATQGNLNNHIGVPLSVLKLRSEHQFAVFELGMNHVGEIAQLAQIAQPQIALVNNAQREHQEFLQSVDAVAQENGSVFQYLTPNGVAVFPAGDAYTTVWQTLATDKVQYLFGPEGVVRANDVQLQAQGSTFELCIAEQHQPVSLSIPGQHNVHNALAASTCCWAAGIAIADIVQGLQAFQAVKGRLCWHAWCQGCLIDDTYNANPDSVKAAIDVLSTLPHPRVLILGDMAEVGDNAAAMHAEVGHYARTQQIDHLIVKGQWVQHTAQAFGGQAVPVVADQDIITLVQQWQPHSIMVKGSRSAHMETVVQALLAMVER